MASAKPKKTAIPQPAVKNGLTFVWLDDSPEQDPNMKSTFLNYFEQVFLFNDINACLELLESADNEEPCIFILVSGKCGQTIVPTRVQPLNQVRSIYVYCYDISKHNQWALKCSKVRCVESDFNKIHKRIQHDVKKAGKSAANDDVNDDEPVTPTTSTTTPPPAVPITMNEIVVEDEYECFTDENNFFDRLAFDVLIDKSNDIHDGKGEFEKSIEGSKLKKFQPNQPIYNWFKEDLFFLEMTSINFEPWYVNRWFLRVFYEQLTHEYEDLIARITDFTTYTSICLTTNELNRMKTRLGQELVCQEFLLTSENKDKVLKSIKKSKDEKPHRVILEIIGDTSTKPTVPYAEIRKNEILFWFNTRFRLMKMELVGLDNDPKNSYWMITLNLLPAYNPEAPTDKLYRYYLETLLANKNVQYSLGKILFYKGHYAEAEKWFERTKNYEELTELALRQFELNKAKEYLEHLSNDTDQANFLRAFFYILFSNENISKARTILMQILSEANDRLIRAQANLAFGHIHLNCSHQVDQAFDSFKIGSNALMKILPEYHPDIAKALIGLGYVYFTQEKYDEAQDSFERAFHIQKEIYTNKHPDCARTRIALAHCLAMKKQTIKQALEELKQAYDILIRTYATKNQNHPQLLLMKQDFDKLSKGQKLQARDNLLDYI